MTSFTQESYLKMKNKWRKRPSDVIRRVNAVSVEANVPFSPGRDPLNISTVIAQISQDYGWTKSLEQARLIKEWPELVGASTAAHTKPVELKENTLIVQCDSTSWAAQLRFMQTDVLTKIVKKYENAEIQKLRFLGPGVPSWKHGKRVVKGRGPRDTYG